jgi:uncharacterized phage protein (TIGR01671 family)
MREIKFRAWDKTEKRLLTGQTIPQIILNFINVNWSSIELMQFTGLKDKNGVEIYEGDIVKCKLFYTYLPVKEENFVVEYGRFLRDNKNAGFYPFHRTINGYEIIESEVIGNIYENKDLLNESQ